MNSVYNDYVLNIQQRTADRKARFAMKKFTERKITKIQLKKYDRIFDNRWAILTNQVQKKIEDHLFRDLQKCVNRCSEKSLRKKRQTLKRIEKLLLKEQTNTMVNSKVSG